MLKVIVGILPSLFIVLGLIIYSYIWDKEQIDRNPKNLLLSLLFIIFISAGGMLILLEMINTKYTITQKVKVETIKEKGQTTKRNKNLKITEEYVDNILYYTNF